VTPSDRSVPGPGRAADRDDTRDLYARSGIGARVGYGSRPALVVVDLQTGFTDPSSPAGSDLTPVVNATTRVLELARERSMPIAYTAVGFDRSLRDGTTWLRKMPGLECLIDGSDWCKIDPRIAPRDDEPVWVKRAPSAFYGTPLSTFLVAERVDTLIVTGCVTSGCIRATVVDAASAGYRTIVPLECVGDRATGVHDAAIFDMDAKYADVEPVEDVLATLRTMTDVGSQAVSI
jgi:nicotinamidase-related amidase